MPRLYLIRHAKPAAGWGDEADPGLDDSGRQQADAVARALVQALRPMPLFSSPMRRCRETAAPLERLWGRTAALLEAVAEIPAPPGGPQARKDWLAAAMQGTWRDLSSSAPPASPDYAAWRQTLLGSLLAMPDDCVVCSHFIAINAVVGAATGRDDVVCFRPGHASVTCVEVARGEMRIVELGAEANGTVLPR